MGSRLDHIQLTQLPGRETKKRMRRKKTTLDNSAWRRGSNLFCSARPALQGFPPCVGKGRNDPQRGGICGTTCVVPPHHLACVCVCGGVLFFWAGNAILGLLRSGLHPLPLPFYYCDDDHARRRRWAGWPSMAGWQPGLDHPTQLCGRNGGRQQQRRQQNKTRRDRLTKGRIITQYSPRMATFN